MSEKKNILAISGSTRKGSSNEIILKQIAEMYKDILDLDIYDGIDKLPHFNPDLDEEEPPAVVGDFRKRIEQADGIIICTPEYVFSIPGSLKNALEWNVSTMVFTNKPVAFIIASASGEKAFESLALILNTIGARIKENSRLLIKGAKGKIGPHGDITDANTLYKIEALVRSLIQTIEDDTPKGLN